MGDFESSFWHWYIVIPTVLGIIACFVLVLWMNTGEKPKEGEEVKTVGHVWDENLEELNNPLPGWWKNMFFITIVFGIGYLYLYPGLGAYKGALDWSQQGQHAEEVKIADEEFGPIYAAYAEQSIKALGSDPKAMKAGERLYLTYCTACHGSDARGVKGFPNLTDSDWIWGGQPSQIKTSILKGRTGTMPGWKTSLGEDGVKEVTQFVLSLSERPNVDQEMAKKGKQKYAMFCAGCHQANGKGLTALGAPNLTDNIWLYGGHQNKIAETIANGRVGVMPPHEDFLGEDRVHLISAYIYNLSN